MRVYKIIWKIRNEGTIETSPLYYSTEEKAIKAVESLDKEVEYYEMIDSGDIIKKCRTLHYYIVAEDLNVVYKIKG